MICGNKDVKGGEYFKYRSSSYLTEFFRDCGLGQYIHHGETRKWWVSERLEEVLSEPIGSGNFLPVGFVNVIRELMDKADAQDDDPDRTAALVHLNISLNREGLEAFYDESNICQIRNTGTDVSTIGVNTVQRAWTADELRQREKLSEYLDEASEDQIIEEVLLPMYRQLGFQRITPSGHKDKALEYGKDIWMKYQLPTRHNLYFGIQVKKGKLDATGKSKNTNVVEILTQVKMMIDHMVFDPEINKRRLVDHVFIVAGGEITKQARNWLAERLDRSERSQILFMERSDILDLCIWHKVPIPKRSSDFDDFDDFDLDIPF